MTKLTYQEFLILSFINTWPELGHSTNKFIDFVVNSTEGDPRGNACREECEIALKEMLEKNWIKPNKDFIYPTELGIKIFEETKDYWFKLYKEKRRVDGQNQINKL